MKCAAAILAAGASTRLGEAKQLVTINGERLLERAVRVALEAGCDPVLVVLGSRSDEIRAVCSLDRARVVANDEWQEGMASSIRAAVSACPHEVAGLLVMTCDQPSVTPEHLRLLVRDGHSTTGSRYGGRIGVPAYFPVSQLAELASLRGDQGARLLLQECPAIELVDGDLDIDTAEALALARSKFSRVEGSD